MQRSESDLIAAALDALSRHAGITAQPDAVLVGKHADCIPQYELGHAARGAAVRNDVLAAFQGRVTLVGNTFDGVGSSDCVVGALTAVDALIARIGPKARPT
jgi:oxygen-dependent protoporphyrinogen oxidase